MNKCYIGILLVLLILLYPLSANASSDNYIYPLADNTDNELIYEKVTLSTVHTVKNGLPTITGTKTAEYKNTNGITLWSVSVTASFNYNGSNVACISCSHSTTVYNHHWSIQNSFHSISGNSATATAIARYGVNENTATYTKSVTIQCDRNGFIS